VVIGAAELETNCLQLLLCHGLCHVASQQTRVEIGSASLRKDLESGCHSRR